MTKIPQAQNLWDSVSIKELQLSIRMNTLSLRA